MQLSTGPAGRDPGKERKLYGCDIETVCDEVSCPGYNHADPEKCDHGLDAFRNRITNIAVSDGLFDEQVWSESKPGCIPTEGFNQFLKENPDVGFTFHKGSFDFKVLLVKGAALTLDQWQHDSLLLAFNYPEKIPNKWLANYDEEHKKLNKERKGLKHREAGKHSLKTVAPFYLGVEPFWEPEGGHADEVYVLKDTKYSLGCTEYFLEQLKKNYPKIYDFYIECHLPWTKNLVMSELRGIPINMEKVEGMWQKAGIKERELNGIVNALWSQHFAAYKEQQQYNIIERYKEMANKGKQGPRKWSDKLQAMNDRNKEKALSRIEPLNLDSPAQMAWLLKERLELDISDPENGKESTDWETLERLSLQKPEIKNLMEYREVRKLNTSFFPSYKEKQINGIIHTNFSSTGTRTGRLSCSNPNLQQVPGHLHEIFEARPGHKLITLDLSGIEPVVLAYYTEDAELCSLLLNGGRFHSVNAMEMFGLQCLQSEVKKGFPKEDSVAKTVGLAVLYGAGKVRVLQTLRQEGFHQFNSKDAIKMVYRIRDKYSGVWEFKGELDKELEKGEILYNLLGRPMRIEDPEDVYMKGLNTLIQGSASDIVQAAAYKVRFELGYEPLLLVHDELVTEVPESQVDKALKEISEVMTSVVKLETKYGIIPIKVEGNGDKVWKK